MWRHRRFGKKFDHVDEGKIVKKPPPFRLCEMESVTTYSLVGCSTLASGAVAQVEVLEDVCLTQPSEYPIDKGQIMETFIRKWELGYMVDHANEQIIWEERKRRVQHDVDTDSKANFGERSCTDSGHITIIEGFKNQAMEKPRTNYLRLPAPLRPTTNPISLNSGLVTAQLAPSGFETVDSEVR
ncbi:hypothetical protein BYT27DRAFT_7334515 [Phlegmacium glaucopus]|nr:hypothetical protein BYT27DRAFT_7334515 [Phlegmacium glaucopus]